MKIRAYGSRNFAIVNLRSVATKLIRKLFVLFKLCNIFILKQYHAYWKIFYLCSSLVSNVSYGDRYICSRIWTPFADFNASRILSSYVWCCILMLESARREAHEAFTTIFLLLSAIYCAV